MSHTTTLHSNNFETAEHGARPRVARCSKRKSERGEYGAEKRRANRMVLLTLGGEAALDSNEVVKLMRFGEGKPEVQVFLLGIGR